MSELLLAIARDDLLTLKKMDQSLIRETWGVKVLLNDTYQLSKNHREKEKVPRFAGASALARIWGAKNILLDAKFAMDTEQEMREGVESVVEMAQPRDMKPTLGMPTAMTVSTFAPISAIRAFEHAVRQADIDPVCFVSSSRVDALYYARFGELTPASFALRQVQELQEHTTINGVLCAASDAETIKKEFPDVRTFVTGASLEGYGTYEHARPAVLQDTLPFNDIVVLGSPIFRSDDPNKQLERYIEAVKTVV